MHGYSEEVMTEAKDSAIFLPIDDYNSTIERIWGGLPKTSRKRPVGVCYRTKNVLNLCMYTALDSILAKTNTTPVRYHSTDFFSSPKRIVTCTFVGFWGIGIAYECQQTHYYFICSPQTAAVRAYGKVPAKVTGCKNMSEGNGRPSPTGD